MDADDIEIRLPATYAAGKVADLIANAPTDLTRLLAAIEAQDAKIEALMKQLVAREERWKSAWGCGQLTHDEAVSATQEDRWAYGELADIRFRAAAALGSDTTNQEGTQ